MDLVVHQMVELQIVHDAHGDPVFKGFARAAVIEHGLAVLVHPGHAQAFLDVRLSGAVEHRGGDVPAELSAGRAQVHFQHLADVHARRHAQGVQNDLQRHAAREEGHILFRQYAGDDALVAVAAGHLVPHADLALLGDVNPHHALDPGERSARFSLASKTLTSTTTPDSPWGMRRDVSRTSSPFRRRWRAAAALPRSARFRPWG